MEVFQYLTRYRQTYDKKLVLSKLSTFQPDKHPKQLKSVLKSKLKDQCHL